MFEKELQRAVSNHTLTNKEKLFWLDLKSSLLTKRIEKFISILKENNDIIQKTNFDFDIKINKLYQKHMTEWGEFTNKNIIE